MFGLTRGRVDSYERSIAKPPLPILQAIAKHFAIPIESITSTDLQLKSFSSTPTEANTMFLQAVIHEKNELIELLKNQLKMQMNVIEVQQALIVKKNQICTKE